MLGLISYLLQVDKETWGAFKERLREEGGMVGDTLRALIHQYIDKGLEKKPKKKDK